MSLVVIPILHELYLVADQIEIPENRIVPIEISNSGKITKAILFKKSRDFYILNSLYWKKTKIVKGAFLYHFHEIVVAYAHNRLRAKQEHLIFNKKEGYGIKLYYGKSKEIDLYLEVYDANSNSFTAVQRFSKVECCIMARILNDYFHKGEIANETFDGSVKCNYGEESFVLESPRI